MNLTGSSDASATPRKDPMPMASHSAFSSTLSVMVSGNSAAMAAAMSASAVGVTTLAGAATSCLVRTTPDAAALAATSSAATSTPVGVTIFTSTRVLATGFDLNRWSSNVPTKAPRAMDSAFERNAASSSPIQYLPMSTEVHLAFCAAAVAALPKDAHVSGVTSLALPRPTTPTCLNFCEPPNTAGRRVKADEPALPVNSISCISSYTTAPSPSPNSSNSASPEAASAAASPSHRLTTNMSAEADPSWVFSTPDTTRSPKGCISPGG
mmetsp:Transcript_21436/g.34685  ORF Transcript_21436/g.34685 Transcript_21436/m.34685 type:complete len:267 (+) Transcript_21436:415-1215(+)